MNDENSFVCPSCSQSFPKLISLSIHWRGKHRSSAKELFARLYHQGNIPLCKCGCKEECRFLDIGRGFTEYVRGHASRVKNNWGHNKEALIKSQAVRRENWNNGTYQTWSQGLTVETDERLAGAAKKQRENYTSEMRAKATLQMKKNWEEGRIPVARGADHSQWKGGVSGLSDCCYSYRKLYAEWKFPLLKKAGFVCQQCGADSSHKLHVHHDKEKMSEIIRKIAASMGWNERYFALGTGDDPDAQSLKLKIAEKVALYHVENQVSGLVLCCTCHEKEHSGMNFHSKKD